ncbi:organomercurial lyase [Dactylosporangium sp. CA-092794]|uniref:organomercurial lyase n=1 Tax=Dactylosporangium sp. CA-092794 TaxID=3239929 RepID=UPI003D8BC950
MNSPPRSFSDVLPVTLAALARGGIAASQAKLPPALRAFHRDLLQIFLDAGIAPTLEQLVSPAAARGLELVRALDDLAEADLVHADAGARAIRVAYPLSGRPSPHRVQLVGDRPPLAAMCAVDALGIPLMVHVTATILSGDPTTGEQICINADPDGWRWRPASTVVLLATEDCGGPIAGACTSTGFHVSRAHAETYLTEHPEYTGQILEQEEAIAIASSEFGRLLDSAE